MARTNIVFNGYDLQSSNIVVSNIAHEDIGHKTLNIQKFSDRGGGKLNSIGFEVKRITLTGTIKGTSKSDLESTIDTFKKNLNAREKNLDIDYSSGTRRYIATCSRITFLREYFVIDAIGFELEFTITDPVFGISLDTSTIEYLALSGTSGGSTLTLEADGYADYSGTIRPNAKIKITINSCLGIRRINFENTNEDGFFSRTRIETPTARKFQNGDIIIIDTEDGSVTLNGNDLEFEDGFPKFSLTNNEWTLVVVGQSYNIDVKIIYYSLWL